MAIDPEIYADNDADLTVEDLPTGLTVQWGIVALGVGGIAPAPSVALDSINAALTGTMSEAGAPPVYSAVLEGAAITDHLLSTYEDEQVAFVVRVGQDLRVYGTTTVRRGRLANA
jgi:hypothetical protein